MYDIAMYFELKENRPHGTTERPFSLYHIRDIHHAFQIPVHWHDELEIIYVKNGALSVAISGENYLGNPGEAFDQGITHFELANNYGSIPGSAEENLGRIMESDL